jgi:short-subunit dehydrogenase
MNSANKDHQMRAIITGGTKGIGKAIAIGLAKAGYDLAICSRNEKDLNTTGRILRELNPDIEVIYLPTDVSDKSQVLRFVHHISAKWNRVNLLINNAGTFTPGEIHKEPDGVLEKMMNTNLYSAYHLTRAVLPLMLPFKSGHIINICSIASIIAYPNGGSYSISKFAMLGFSKVLREEMKENGIKVTSVIPGATWTNSWEGADFPQSRLMKPEDIAEAILSAIQMSPSAVVEEIIIRPQLGDL